MMNTNPKVTGVYYTYKGDEETMKGLVAEHGAVVTRCIPAKCRFRWSKQPISSVGAGGPMQNYEGGVFGGCTSDQTDHAVTVVGYGTDAATGDDYGVGSFISHLHRSRLLENQELLGQLLGGAG